MKIIASSGTLLKQLQTIYGALTSSTTLPILENFLFIIEKTTLTVAATDLQTSMTSKLAIESKDSGKVCIPSKILISTLSQLPEQPITININKDNFAIELLAGEGSYKMAGEDGEDFPNIPDAEGAQNISIPASVLSDAITKTIFAVSNDELRPAMTGVFCQIATDNITFVATDAHKLVRYRRFDAKGDAEHKFILPKKALNLLKNALPTEDVQVNIDFNQSHAFFQFANIKLVCRLIDEKYPDYEAVIPLSNPNVMKINRDLLLLTVKRVANYASKSTNQIRLKISAEDLIVRAEDLDFANEAQEKLKCEYTGEDIEIGFNAKFLIDMLSNIGSDEVSLEMSTPNRAGILLPTTTDANESVLMLVMPVMINN